MIMKIISVMRKKFLGLAKKRKTVKAAISVLVILSCALAMGVLTFRFFIFFIYQIFNLLSKRTMFFSGKLPEFFTKFCVNSKRDCFSVFRIFHFQDYNKKKRYVNLLTE